MDKPVRYDVFVELFYILGINPYAFKQLSGDNVMGYFPDLKGREPKIDVKALAEVLWNTKV